MKLNKSHLQKIIKEELQKMSENMSDDMYDRSDDLDEKLKDAVAIALEAGLPVEHIEKRMAAALEQVTGPGWDMQTP
jgi:TRAP-type C4-dicarboxylate transport system substrate-binding protein